MKVIMLTENDPAGMGIAFTNAINQHTDHYCRLITTAEKYCFNFVKDVHIPDMPFSDSIEWHEVEDLLKFSDIFHFQILSDESMQLGPFKVADYIKGKKIVHHHHGHDDFRTNPEKYRQKYKKLNRKVLVSTPDLLLGLPEAYWMPNCVPVNDPLYMPTEKRYEEFTVGHSPTRLALKNTADLVEAANKAGVNVDIIMNTDHRECLRRKQKCHVIFDHLQGYYGVSSLEGLSMDKEVFAGLSEYVEKKIREFTEVDFHPWWIPTKENLWKFLKVSKDEFPEKIMNHGCRDFMVNHWSDKKVVTRLIKFYETL